jgi:hypothetical protein
MSFPSRAPRLIDHFAQFFGPENERSRTVTHKLRIMYKKICAFRAKTREPAMPEQKQNACRAEWDGARGLSDVAAKGEAET